MKKILSLIFFCVCVSFNTHAQTKLVTISNATDTLKNADTLYHTIEKVSYYPNARFTMTLDKVSGTVGGTVLLQGSSDVG